MLHKEMSRLSLISQFDVASEGRTVQGNSEGHCSHELSLAKCHPHMGLRQKILAHGIPEPACECPTCSWPTCVFLEPLLTLLGFSGF